MLFECQLSSFNKNIDKMHVYDKISITKKNLKYKKN